MTRQPMSSLDSIDLALASLELALRESQREIDLLKGELVRSKRQNEEVQERAIMMQAAFDRHFSRCGRDDGATQRLMASLAEATARRKEQAAIIERRNDRIEALQKELDELKGGGVGLGSAIGRSLSRPNIFVARLRKMFSTNIQGHSR
jgi:chromosome segregation ATPase